MWREELSTKEAVGVPAMETELGFQENDLLTSTEATQNAATSRETIHVPA